MKSKTKSPKTTLKYRSPNSLQELLDFLDTHDVKKSNYNKVLFELDWSGVYYEGESPEIKVVYEH